jgi:septum site-determining protein MinD
MSQDTVYAIASGKGGVGKTTTTVNLGTALAGAGNEVVVVDVDLGMANLAGFVSLEPGEATLHDVLGGAASVEAATYELASSIYAVPGGMDLDSYAETETEALSRVVDELRERFDYVLLDVGAGVSHETVLPLGLADSVLVVSTPEPASVQDSQKTVGLTQRAGGSVDGLIVTRVHPDSDVSYTEIADGLGLELLATIPEDSAVRGSVFAGTPLVVHEPDSPAAMAYKRLAARVLGRTDERGPTHEEPTESDATADSDDDDGDDTDDTDDTSGTSQDAVRASIREAETDGDEAEDLDDPATF